MLFSAIAVPVFSANNSVQSHHLHSLCDICYLLSFWGKPFSKIQCNISLCFVVFFPDVYDSEHFLNSLFCSKIFVCDFCCLRNYLFVLSSNIILAVCTSYILVVFQFWIYESNMNNDVIKYLHVLFCVDFSFGFL